jgi:hypothetical protein
MSNIRIADISVLENLQATQNTKAVASQMTVFNSVFDADIQKLVEDTFRAWRGWNHWNNKLNNPDLNLTSSQAYDIQEQADIKEEEGYEFNKQLFQKLKAEKVRIISGLKSDLPSENIRKEKQEFNRIIDELSGVINNIEFKVGKI